MPSTDHSPAPGEPVLVLPAAGPDGAPTPRLADPAAPHLTVTDQGATRGDGLFETALAVADVDQVPVSLRVVGEDEQRAVVALIRGDEA